MDVTHLSQRQYRIIKPQTRKLPPADRKETIRLVNEQKDPLPAAPELFHRGAELARHVLQLRGAEDSPAAGELLGGGGEEEGG